MQNDASVSDALRVVIADDHRPFAEGLAAWLTDLGARVVDIVPDGQRLLARITADPPDVVVTDVTMPPHKDEGIRVAEELEATHPAIGVLVVSSYSEASWADRLFARRQQGVGYLIKDSLDDSTVLWQALRRVASGGHWIDSKVALEHLQLTANNGLGPYGGPGPTPRELEVLRAMGDGLSNKAIAARLRISDHTVQNHINKLFAKLGIGNDPHFDPRVQAVRWLYDQSSHTRP